MAVDTRDKRASVLGLGLASLLVLPAPGTLDQGDRQQTAYSYRGILATSVTLPTFTYVATYQTSKTYAATFQSTKTDTSTFQTTKTYEAEWD